MEPDPDIGRARMNGLIEANGWAAIARVQRWLDATAPLHTIARSIL
jgi:hypothetical protein